MALHAGMGLSHQVKAASGLLQKCWDLARILMQGCRGSCQRPTPNHALGGAWGAIKAGLGRVASMSWSLQAREATGLLAQG